MMSVVFGALYLCHNNGIIEVELLGRHNLNVSVGYLHMSPHHQHRLNLFDLHLSSHHVFHPRIESIFSVHLVD